MLDEDELIPFDIVRNIIEILPFLEARLHPTPFGQ
jgi:hypothetical protein